MLKLNPNDVQMRLEYARALASFGASSSAYFQFSEALRYNDLLDAAETKRLKPAEIQSINEEMKKLP